MHNLIIYPAHEEWVLAHEFSHEELLRDSSATRVLAEAVLYLQEGGHLRLSSGDFYLDREISVNATCRITGSGAATRILPSNDFEGVALISLDGADRSHVGNLLFDGMDRCENGLMLRDCVECSLAGIMANRFTQSGIVLRDNCSCCNVSNCSASENARANFLFDQQAFGGRIGNFPPNVVNACTAIGGGHGFEIHKTTVFNITASTAFQPRGHGFYIHQTSNSVLVSGCRTFQCELSAVYVENAHELNISSNIFCWQRGDGIVLNNVNWAAINGNEVIDSGVRDLDGVGRTGLLLHSDSKGIQIVGNTIFNWGDQPPMAHGIRESSDCSENLFANNHINYVSGEPIISKGRGSIVGENLIVAKAAYRNMDKPPFPDFDRTAIQQYVKPKHDYNALAATECESPPLFFNS
jgi:hypothetical protein